MGKDTQLPRTPMKDPRIKILFILPSLKAGGAERVMTFIATSLDPNKFLCQLLILGKAEDAVYSTGNVDAHFLNKKRLVHSVRAMFKYISSNRPNIVIGSIAHVNRVLTIFKLLFPKIKFVGREASIKSVISKFVNKDRIQYWKLYDNYHKNLDMVICQSQDMVNDLTTGYGVPKRKIRLINNPITGHLPLKQPLIGENKVKQLITIGRLSPEKGYYRILNVLSRLKIPFHYTIIGVGIEKEKIFELIKQLQLENKITYIPHTNNVAKFLSESDLFLQGSIVEGFPNALLESCVVGTPVIAFNAIGGTKDIIEIDVNGYMANDEDEFLDLIQKALVRTWNPKEISRSVTKKYNKAYILSQYETFFEDLAGPKTKPKE